MLNKEDERVYKVERDVNEGEIPYTDVVVVRTNLLYTVFLLCSFFAR